MGHDAMNRREFVALAALTPFAARAHGRGPEATPEAGAAPPLARGWNTWDTRSALRQVRAEDGLCLNLSFWHFGLLAAVRDVNFGTTTQGPSTGVKLVAGAKARTVTVQPGLHAYDGSYTAVTVILGEVTILVETAHMGAEGIAILVQPSKADFKAPLLGVEPMFVWNRPGEIVRKAPGGMMEAVTPAGRTSIRASTPPTEEPDLVTGWAFPLTGQIALAAGGAPEDVPQVIAAARQRHRDRSRRYAPLAEQHGAYQACLAWNTVYIAKEKRVLTTSSRQWNVLRFGYGLFGWDTFFHGWLMAADDAPLARNCVRQILREMIGGEFVPNVVNGSGRKSKDRSQPCVGALSVLAMHELAPDDAFLAEVWPKLLTWNRWWHRERRNRMGLLSWGSVPFRPEVGDAAELIQPGTALGAAIESGLDNSPMYEGVPYDARTHLMQLSDVGLGSLYVSDCEALAAIGRILGHAAEAAELEQRRRSYAEGIQGLWNPAAGIFQNRRTDTGVFSPRISPTSFYPMLAGAASASQADAMVRGYVVNPVKFGGTWPLPSVPRDDPAFPDQVYLHGRVWAPLNFLTYLGLKRYGRRPEAAHLAERSVTMFTQNWEQRHGVFENYSALTGLGGDVPLCDPMCAWSGLLVLMGLMEAGRMPLPSILRRAPSPA